MPALSLRAIGASGECDVLDFEDHLIHRTFVSRLKLYIGSSTCWA
jgi:hypothetical protein